MIGYCKPLTAGERIRIARLVSDEMEMLREMIALNRNGWKESQ